MKILLVSQFYYPERFSVSDIAESFVKQGNEVSVITGKPNYGYGYILKEYKKVKYEVINGVKVHRVKLFARKKSRVSICLNYLSFHHYAKRFVRHFKEEFDVVFSISLSPVISIAPAVLYRKKHHVKHILYCQDLWPESTVVTNAVKKGSLIYKILYKWSVSLYRKCDDIILSSPSFETYFKNELNISDKTFKVVNQPIIESKNSIKDITPHEFKERFNFVYGGNIGKLQLVDKLVLSMKYVNTKSVKLHLLGMGSEVSGLNELIRKNKLEDKVEYVGAFPIEVAEQYYASSTALIAPLKNTGIVGKTIPNKVVQYLKYGKPILGIIEGDGKQLLENANGTIFTSEDPKDIALIIDEICNKNSAELELLGKNNKNYFDKNLTSEILSIHLLECIKESIK